MALYYIHSQNKFFPMPNFCGFFFSFLGLVVLDVSSESICPDMQTF